MDENVVREMLLDFVDNAVPDYITEAARELLGDVGLQ
jgi:hypothetical protein